jgi:uncharacterized protein (DUF1501 family)
VTAVTDDANYASGVKAGRVAAQAAEGCAESRLLMSRRAMLGVTAGLFSWAYMPRYAEAGAGNDPRLLIVVLRGGMDGINVVVPFGDRSYASMRGAIAIPKSDTLRIDNFFGLHPSLVNFNRMYLRREAAVVHATCVPLRNRSHFDGQDNLESGLPGLIDANPTGWLNRLLTALPAGAPVKLRGAIQIGDSPLILRGPAPVLGWSPTWFSSVEDPTLYMVETLYRSRDREMYDVLERGLKAHQLASRLDKDDGSISALRKGFRGAGRLVGSPTGPRIAVLSVGGWDTHSNQDGQLAGVLGELDLAMQDFKDAVGSAWGNTVMVLATEFGRTVRVNGDRGTDHGVGTVALLAGGAVNGRRVFGDWPGLAANRLYEGSDLAPTTDLRSVFKGVLRDHIGVPNNLLNTSIFPESASAAPLRNLVKTSSASQPVAASASAPVAVRAETPIARYRRGRRVAQARAL